MTRMTKRGVDDVQNRPCRPVWLLIGQRIRARRLQCGHSVRHLADELGVSQAAYVRSESGDTPLPAMQLSQLSKLLGVPIIWFFQDASPARESGNCIDHASPVAYRVATLEQRLGALADSFRKLDLERQQYLLAIADALCRTDGKGKAERAV
jgi:transcriptional regulator with XRE-family HTH domain